MSQTVSLDVSRDGLVAHMRDQFVHSDTFLRELLQNSRRAGASQIDVQFDRESKVLVIADDGRGIAAPEDLFVLGRSGFRNDPGVERAENPFGMGFAASLFAASFISVRTRTFSCEFNTESALSFGGVNINTSYPGFFFEGTRIELTLTESRAKTLFGVSEDAAGSLSHFKEDLLARIVAGFPIPVRFNGNEISRPDALGEGFVEHSGLLVKVDFPAMADTRRGFHSFESARCYFQGLPLNVDALSRAIQDDVNVIHVGDGFRLRTPDRDTIVDEQTSDFRKAQEAAFTAIWREHLARAKQEMDAEAFLTTWLSACKRFAPELLNDLPLAPGMYDVLDLPPRHERYMGEISDNECVHKSFLPVGSRVALLDTGYVFEGDLERSSIGLYAMLKGLPIIDPNDLPEGHWARESCVSLDALKPRLQPHNVVGETPFYSQNALFPVVLCSHYTLDPQDGSEPIDVYDWPVWDAAGVKDKLIVPRKAGAFHIEEALLQVCSYMDEVEQFMEAELDSDTDRLTMTARLMFDDDCSVLGDYLRLQLGSVCDALRGRRFSVEIDESGQPSVKAA